MTVIHALASMTLAGQNNWAAIGSGQSAPDHPVRCGVSASAVAALDGDGLVMTLPPVRSVVTAGEKCGEIRSGDRVIDVYAAISGLVTINNPDALDDHHLVIDDPEEAGWLFAVLMAPDTEAARTSSTID